MAIVHSTEPAAPLPQPPKDHDSIYWSKERWRIIPQRLGPMSIQYLVIDAHHNEIVATYSKMLEAMDHRDRLDSIISEFEERSERIARTLPHSLCEELAHE